MTKLTFAIKEVNRCQLKRNHVDDLTKFLIVLLRTEGLIHKKVFMAQLQLRDICMFTLVQLKWFKYYVFSSKLKTR